MQSIDIALPLNILFTLSNKDIFNKRPTTLNFEFSFSKKDSSGEETPLA